MPVVELDQIHKSFGEIEVLKGVSVTAHEGEVVALIGSSGSGKSTLLRCINMLEVPDSGTVRIAGETISLIGAPPHRKPSDEAQIRRLLGFCGLPFDPACLAFHRSSRPVLTISSAQVRQPLRRDTARSARYGHKLDPLRARLRAAGLETGTEEIE